jgi:hypothetical protein
VKLENQDYFASRFTGWHSASNRDGNVIYLDDEPERPGSDGKRQDRRSIIRVAILAGAHRALTHILRCEPSISLYLVED